MRNYLSEYFSNRAKNDPDFLVLSGDHGYSLFDLLRKNSPESFVNVGIAEQNMIGVAAGLAQQGLKPLVYGLAAFMPVRVLEQIKLDLCHPKLPVILLGDGAGVVYSTLGVSHQCLEDMAVLRSLPNISIYSPADVNELVACLEHAEQSDSPAYIRIGKGDRPAIHKKKVLKADLELGLLPVFSSEKNISIIGTGTLLSSAQKLVTDGDIPSINLFSLPLVKAGSSVLQKTIRTNILNQIATQSVLITLEEHATEGGLGSLISELIAQEGLSCRVIRIGSPLMFSETVGSYEHVLSQHGLDMQGIRSQILSGLTRKESQHHEQRASYLDLNTN